VKFTAKLPYISNEYEFEYFPATGLFASFMVRYFNFYTKRTIFRIVSHGALAYDATRAPEERSLCVITGWSIIRRIIIPASDASRVVIDTPLKHAGVQRRRRRRPAN